MYLHKKRHDFLLFIDSWYMINLDARGEHNALTLIHLFLSPFARNPQTHTRAQHRSRRVCFPCMPEMKYY